MEEQHTGCTSLSMMACFLKNTFEANCHHLTKFFFFFFLYQGLQDLISQPWIEPVPLALKAQSSNHWTTREFSLIKIWENVISFLFTLTVF